jgi:hypothetical protein
MTGFRLCDRNDEVSEVITMAAKRLSATCRPGLQYAWMTVLPGMARFRHSGSRAAAIRNPDRANIFPLKNYLQSNECKRGPAAQVIE